MKTLQRSRDILRWYHGYEVRGLDRIPKKGRAIVVVNHSFATYDIALLFDAIQAGIQRTPRPLADRRFFELPFFDRIPAAFSAVEGKPENASQLLRDEQLVLVAPGGMKEMVRPSDEKYHLLWQKRLGFIRLAISTGSPIILAMCPRADDLYQVYRTPLTSLAYKHIRFPVVLARGVGPTVLPRPVKLVHHIGIPIQPPKPGKTRFAQEEQIVTFHEEVCEEAKALIQQALT